MVRNTHNTTSKNTLPQKPLDEKAIKPQKKIKPEVGSSKKQRAKNAMSNKFFPWQNLPNDYRASIVRYLKPRDVIMLSGMSRNIRQNWSQEARTALITSLKQRTNHIQTLTDFQNVLQVTVGTAKTQKIMVLKESDQAELLEGLAYRVDWFEALQSLLTACASLHAEAHKVTVLMVLLSKIPRLSRAPMSAIIAKECDLLSAEHKTAVLLMTRVCNLPDHSSKEIVAQCQNLSADKHKALVLTTLIRRLGGDAIQAIFSNIIEACDRFSEEEHKLTVVAALVGGTSTHVMGATLGACARILPACGRLFAEAGYKATALLFVRAYFLPYDYPDVGQLAAFQEIIKECANLYPEKNQLMVLKGLAYQFVSDVCGFQQTISRETWTPAIQDLEQACATLHPALQSEIWFILRQQNVRPNIDQPQGAQSARPNFFMRVARRLTKR